MDNELIMETPLRDIISIALRAGKTLVRQMGHGKLLLCVFCLFPQFSLASEAIEIIYEQSGSNSDATSIWMWVSCGLVVAFTVAWMWLYSHYKESLSVKDVKLEQSEERLKEAQRIARMGSWNRDFETGETYWSAEARAVLGMENDHEEIRHFESIIHPDDLEKVTEIVASAYYKGGSYQCDHRVICKNNQEKYVRLAGQVFLGKDSDPVRETGTIQDITDRKLAEIALKRSEKRMRSILDAAPYPIIIVEVSSDYPVLYANQNAYTLFGIRNTLMDQEIKTRGLWVNDEERAKFIEEVVHSGSMVDEETVMKGSEGRTFWASLTGNSMTFAGIQSVFISILDITDRKLIQQELERLATTDPLTGVYNRRNFFDLAQKELRRSIRYGHPYAMLMLDLDYFKSVNDQYGHSFGDSVIRRFSEVVMNNLREEDLFGRVGGEEFSAVLVSAENEGAYLVAERIRRCWQEETFDYNGVELHFTVSIGVSEMQSEVETVEDIMERADAGLYKAKRSGRNCVIVFNGEKGDSGPAMAPVR